MTTKSLFKIFLVTKNEEYFIENFIIYYGYHFGYNNLVIIDNESSNENVLSIYKKYIKYGINLFIEKGYENDLQGNHFTKYMNIYKNTCEWMIGLDNDEFIVLKNDNEFSCDMLQNNLINILNKLDKNIDQISVNYDYRSYSINKMINDPLQDINTFFRFGYPTPHYVKFFCRASNFISTHNGNHLISTINNNKIYIDDIVYLHYHDIGEMINIEKAKQICIGYKYITVEDDDITIFHKLTSKKYIYGCHRVEQLINHLKYKFSIYNYIFNNNKLPEMNNLCKKYSINHQIIEHSNQFIKENKLLEQFYFLLYPVSTKTNLITINTLKEFINKITPS
jgi:hypothetical protein